MKFTIMWVMSLSFGIATAQEVVPNHEIGLTLGGLFDSPRSCGLTRLDLGSGVALRLCCKEYFGADSWPALAEGVAYVESPNNWSTNQSCRWTAWPGSHRNCPFRVMCTAS